MLFRLLFARLSRFFLLCGDSPLCSAALNIGDTFAQKYSVLCIHVWLLLVRLRAEGDDGKGVAQKLYENFQDDVEAMVRAEGVTV